MGSAEKWRKCSCDHGENTQWARARHSKSTRRVPGVALGNASIRVSTIVLGVAHVCLHSHRRLSNHNSRPLRYLLRDLEDLRQLRLLNRPIRT